MNEIVFVVEQDPEEGYNARAINESIFTQADSLENLREMIRDAVNCHFSEEENRPQIIRLQIEKGKISYLQKTGMEQLTTDN